MIWWYWVLWHINHCRLFNAKSFSYIYIKCARGVMVIVVGNDHGDTSSNPGQD